MTNKINIFTSTGSKLCHHHEALVELHAGRGHPIVTHIMPTDLCQHHCSFCSVANRFNDVLPSNIILTYLRTLKKIGLKAVIISGGGNPLLYKCPTTGIGIEKLINEIHDMDLEIGLITNGMPLNIYNRRVGWINLRPESIDKLTWIRISLVGLDQDERVDIPDVDPSKTTLGFSYIAHDSPDKKFADQIEELTIKIRRYVEIHKPVYVRLLPDCLEPEKIESRCVILRKMAQVINPEKVFVQYKPPCPPKSCYLGYVHPVLAADGYVYPCDSCTLNSAADHRFAQAWRICHATEIGNFYAEPVHSLIENPAKTCPGCVFSKQNEILQDVVKRGNVMKSEEEILHCNFV